VVRSLSLKPYQGFQMAKKISDVIYLINQVVRKRGIIWTVHLYLFQAIFESHDWGFSTWIHSPIPHPIKYR
jgi:hypothetical protein